MNTLKWALAFLVGCSLSQTSRATTFSYSNTANGQAFVSACAGSQAYGGQANPGGSAMIDPSNGDFPYNACFQAQGATASVGPVVNPVLGAGLFQAPNAFSNSSSMTATVGSIGFTATDTSSSFDIFAGTAGSGGWNDSFTWNGPTGMWEPQLVVNASLSVGYDSCTPYNGYTCTTPNTTPTGEAVLEVAMLAADPNGTFLNYLGTSAEMTDFENKNVNLHPGIPILAAKFGDWLSSVGIEMAGWVANSTTPDVVANGQIITFAIPVVHGETVSFGVYASYMVSGADGGGPSAIFISTQSIDPQTGFADPGVVDTGSGVLPVLPTYITDTQSSFNYSQNYVPEPGAFLLGGLGAGLCLIGKLRSRSRR